MNFNKSNQNQDNFDNFLAQMLKKIVKAINATETTEQFPTAKGRNRLMSNPFINAQRNKQPAPSNSFRLDDFLDDIGIILSDELNGGVTKISADTLMIEFHNGDIFRLKLIKDTNNGDGGIGGYFNFGDGFRGFGGLGDIL